MICKFLPDYMAPHSIRNLLILQTKIDLQTEIQFKYTLI